MRKIYEKRKDEFVYVEVKNGKTNAAFKRFFNALNYGNLELFYMKNGRFNVAKFARVVGISKNKFKKDIYTPRAVSTIDWRDNLCNFYFNKGV